MNGFTFIALVFIFYCVVEFAVLVINNAALYIAREQGERKALDWIAMRQRIEKNGGYNANKGWK